jgi:hypothetical protein
MSTTSTCPDCDRPIPAHLRTRKSCYCAHCDEAWNYHLHVRGYGVGGWHEPASTTDTIEWRKLAAQLIQQERDQEQERNQERAGQLASKNRAGQIKKRSTERGEGRAKLITALTKHHQYAGGCLNLEPIGNNELAKVAQVSPSTASEFFVKEFKGHDKYKALCCQGAGGLVNALKILNGEFSPHILYGKRPDNEDDRDDEE